VAFFQLGIPQIPGVPTAAARLALALDTSFLCGIFSPSTGFSVRREISLIEAPNKDS